MKNILYSLVVLPLLLCTEGQAQYKLEACQQMARENYPMIVQYGLIKSSGEFRIENANSNYLPQLSLSAKATYQSDVTEIPVPIPGVAAIDKDQYNAVLQIEQTIWDGGATSSQKSGINAKTQIDENRLAVDLYALRERVNQLFFSIILINEQLGQTEILLRDLERNQRQVNAYKENGLANQSDIDAIKAERLNALQKETELIANREAYVSMLSAMTGKNLSSDGIFEKPSDLSFSQENRRPELNLFDAQSAFLDSQSGMVAAKNRLKVGAFVQGGYGKPGLNMLKDEFSPFYIAGIKFAWNLSSLYTKKNELRLIDLDKKTLTSQRETFLYNTNLKSIQQITGINKLRSLMERDDELILLRESIKKAAEIKLENGTISVSELLREINMLDIARNNKARHEAELMMAIYDLKHTMNN